MPILAIAAALAQFVPAITKLITGSDKAEQVAAHVVGIAQAVTNQSTPEAALEQMQLDPEKQLEFQRAMSAQEADLEKAYLADRQSARDRDVELNKLGVGNRRATCMIVGTFVVLVICVGVIGFADVPDSIAGILNNVAVGCSTLLTLAFNFEFGSSRGSKEKDAFRRA